MNHIYLLIKNNVPFYVGKTNNIQRRLKEHKVTYNDFEMVVVENTNDTKFWEEWWIELLLGWGYNLTNVYRKSVGVDFHTEETKLKLSKSQKGKSRNQGRKYDDEHKLKMSLAKKGKKLSEQHKLNISKAKQGTKNPKTSESMKLFYEENGCTWGDKISQSKKGKPTNINYESVRIKNSKPILQYNLNGELIREFNSLTEASYIMGIDVGHLSRHLNNPNSNKCKGFKYEFK